MGQPVINSTKLRRVVVETIREHALAAPSPPPGRMIRLD